MTNIDGISPKDPFDGLSIPPQMRRMLTLHADMSLASASGLGSAMRMAPNNLYPYLDWELDDENRSRPLSSTRLGATFAKQDRWWWNEIGCGLLRDLRPIWHEEWARCALLPRVPLLEWYPRVTASLIPQMGQLKHLEWTQNKAVDLVSTYDRDWAAIFWSGFLESEASLTRRMMEFNVSLRDEYHHSFEMFSSTGSKTSLPRAKPEMASFIVPDQWQREIVRRVTSNFFYPVQIWCVADDSVTGATNVGESVDRIPLSVYSRGLGGWPWVRRVEWSPWGPNFPSTTVADTRC